MDVRSLRRKRIAIIVAVVVVLGGLVGVVYVVQKQQSAAYAASLRRDGLAAYAAEDYKLAIDRLQPYVAQHVQDAEAWYAFGRSQLFVPRGNMEHIGEALRALRHVVTSLDPDNLDATRDLLELESLIQQNERALALADKILAVEPRDEVARRFKVIALARLGRNEEAWRLASELVEERPEDLEIQLAVIQLRYTLGHPADAVIGDARALVERYPDDPRYGLMLGTALGMGGHEREGIEQLRKAAAQPMPADVSLLAVIRLLDQTSLFSESLNLLVNEVTPQSDPQLVNEKLRRCFEAGLHDEVRTLLADQDLTAPDADVQVAVIGAMAASQRGDTDRAKAIAAALRAREGDETAAIWGEVLETLLAQDLVAGADSLPVLRRAVRYVQNNAYLHSLLGDALADADEMAQAADAWRQAIALRDVWDAPFRQLARYAMTTGQLDAAEEYAEAAYLRRPGHAENAIVIAQVRSAGIKPGDRETVAEVLRLLDEIDAATGGSTRTLLLRVNTLAQAGETAALHDLLRNVAEQRPQLPHEVISRLIDVAGEYELPVADDLRSLSAAGGETPQSVLAEAVRLIEADQIDEAIELVASRRAPNDPAWDLAWAQTLDRAGDSRAAETWIALTEARADDTRTQVAALRSAALTDNRDAAMRIVQRLRELGSEDGLVWRIEQARWMLRANQGVEDALALLREVLAKNPNDFDARVLSAAAHQHAGRLALAVRELQAAIQQRPDATGLKLDLAALLQRMQSYAAAAEQLNAVVMSPSVSPVLLRRAAMMLAQQGDDMRAISVLEDLRRRAREPNAVDDLLLASLYRRNGQVDDAEQACRRLLEQPTVENILFVAGFYAMQNRGDEALEVLKRVEGLNVPEDAKQAAFASYYSRFGSPDQTLRHYRAAVEAAPDNRDHWRQLISFELTIGEVDAALADARRAAERLGDSPTLEALVRHADVIRRFASVDRWRALVVSIASEPEGRTVALQALRQLDAVGSDDPAKQAAAIHELVQTHDEHLTLQLAAVRAYMDAGQYHEASELATRAMYAHPMSVDAAWIASEALTAEQRWNEALVAASQWRQRSTGQTISADLIVAEARLRLNEVGEALREISPHLDAALADPVNHPAVIFSYARILVASGRAAEARGVLRPLLHVDESWRLLWGRIASMAIGNTADAAAWLAELEPHVPDDAVNEQAQLAQSWWSLFLRSKDPAHRDAAVRWIERVTATSEAHADAFVLHGIISELSGNPDAAERSYRAALERDPNAHAAANNLAMVILGRNGDADEAADLAQRAVDTSPTTAEYLDTLAQAHARAGRYEPAIAAMQRAIRVDPGRAAWQWNLLDLYEAADMDTEADQLRNQLRLQYPLGRPDDAARTLQ